jgi:hypothetical protein
MIGNSRSVRRILLARDFFNWASSRLKLFEYRKQDVSAQIRNFAPLIALWISYAREFSGETDFLRGEEVVKISYSRWTQDRECRSYILGRLGLPLVNNSNDVVLAVGGGSIFRYYIFFGACREDGGAGTLALSARAPVRPGHRADKDKSHRNRGT